MLFSLFSRITREKTVREKIARNDQDVYLYLLFPITVAFLLTFTAARLIRHLEPVFCLHIFPGLPIQHYRYGRVVLTVSGYLALCATKPRDRYLIALLHGLGLGLAFDEFGFLLHLSEVDRFSYDGVTLLVGIFLLLISAEKGARMWRKHFGPSQRVAEVGQQPELAPLETPPQA